MYVASVHANSGAVFFQIGTAMNFMEWAAWNCCGAMPFYKLQTLARSWDLTPASPDLICHLSALIWHQLPGLANEQMSSILEKRTRATEDPLETYPQAGTYQLFFPKGDLKLVKEHLFRLS